jgi:hypothetical protein
MDYESQITLVNNMYKANLGNTFLKSWKPYEAEKEKLELHAKNHLEKTLGKDKIESVIYMQQEYMFRVYLNNKDNVNSEKSGNKEDNYITWTFTDNF